MNRVDVKYILTDFAWSIVKTTPLVMGAALFGCAGAPRPVEPPKPEVRVVSENAIPGTVNSSWVEPMPDVVEVPGQLDPTGTYYLPKRSEVVEIRPERFREVDYGEPVRENSVVEGR